MERARALITAFSVELEKRDGEPLTAERAEAIALALGYGKEEIFELADHLREKGLLEFRWGGRLALTEKGLDFLKPPPAGGPSSDRALRDPEPALRRATRLSPTSDP